MSETELTGLIKQYSDYLDSIRYNKQPASECLPIMLEESEGMIQGFIEWVASELTKTKKDLKELEYQFDRYHVNCIR